MKKKRIFMIGYSTDKGGVESYIRNLCDYLEDDFEIILHWPVMEIDGVRWEIPANRHNVWRYRRFWKAFFKANHFDVVYFNTCDIVSIDMLRFAKGAGVPVRIIHSHNTGREVMRGGAVGLLHKLLERNSKAVLHKYATVLLACSESAGKWMFDGRDYRIIKNGIDIERYKFSTNRRDRINRSLNIAAPHVVACIGRLDPQKNPFFSYEIFKEACSRDKDLQCLFIGDGEHRGELERKAKSDGLSDRIIFTGGVDNVNEWLSYVDALLMPSLFEGLPFALVEAQAAGIHCLVSDTVSAESNITGLVEYKSLDSPAGDWASRLLKLAGMPREDVSDKLAQAGFSIAHTAAEVKHIILEGI